MAYLIQKSFHWQYGILPVFNLLKDRDYFFALDSSLLGSEGGRYSFLGYDPFFILKSIKGENPFARVRSLLNEYKITPLKGGLPFLGGAAGYFSYDLGFCFEDIKRLCANGLEVPEMVLGFYDVIIAIDHLENKLFIISTGFPEKDSMLSERRAESRMKEAEAILSHVDVSQADLGPERVFKTHPCGITSNFTKDKYLDAVRKAKGYIEEGDIYQVNLSQRLSCSVSESSSELYKRLRAVSASSFSAYFNAGDFQVLSSSPERFLLFDGRNVYTRPMKGTRARGKDILQDKYNRVDLWNSPKDKAELVMIVDLMRNDLGKVCEYGSIKVDPMRTLEAYSSVYQTTATIRGRLHRDKDRVDLLKACFPGGSVTGCPKIRAMQIIEELEPDRRGLYTGSLGYLGFNNTMDLNILIRTIIKINDKAYFQAGGGIVADSKPELEYEETLIKAEAIKRAISGVWAADVEPVEV